MLLGTCFLLMFHDSFFFAMNSYSLPLVLQESHQCTHLQLEAMWNTADYLLIVLLNLNFIVLFTASITDKLVYYLSETIAMH